MCCKVSSLPSIQWLQKALQPQIERPVLEFVNPLASNALIKNTGTCNYLPHLSSWSFFFKKVKLNFLTIVIEY